MQLNLGNYASVPDFIYGITGEIREDCGIGRKLEIYDAKDFLPRAATGFTGCHDGVTTQSLQALLQFPECQYTAEMPDDEAAKPLVRRFM